MTTGSESTTTTERLRGPLGGLLALPALLTLSVAGMYAVGDAVLAGAPSPKDPGFVDGVLASGAVLAAIRLAIIAAAAYIVASIVALIARRQWLTRVGPVEVSAQVSDLQAENTMLRSALDSAEKKADYLEEELAVAEDLVDSMLGNIGKEWERK
jgi:hypothetical protein